MLIFVDLMSRFEMTGWHAASTAPKINKKRFHSEEILKTKTNKKETKKSILIKLP